MKILLLIAVGVAIGWSTNKPQWFINLVEKVKSAVKDAKQAAEDSTSDKG